MFPGDVHGFRSTGISHTRSLARKVPLKLPAWGGFFLPPHPPFCCLASPAACVCSESAPKVVAVPR